MKSYLGLVKEYARVHRKRDRLALCCIVIAVSLVTTIFGMADMAVRALKRQYMDIYGNWHVVIEDLPKGQVQLLGQREDIEQMGYGLMAGLEDGVSYKGHAVAAVGMEKGLAEYFNVEMVEGSWPEMGQEAAITENAAADFGIGIGDLLELELGNGRQGEFTVTGIMEDTASTLMAGSGGVALTPEAFRRVMGEMAYGEGYYITFKEHVDIRKSLGEIEGLLGISGDRVGENAVLLAAMGQSRDSSMNEFYLTAFMLFLLVLASGVLIIAGSFSTNIMERTRFFGMLRCLGASKAQVRRLVLKEGLCYGYRAVPIGMAVGMVAVWILCWVLQMFGSRYFAQIPVGGISLPSLGMGALAGFLTVITSSLSPCRRASRVSPLSAVSGNREAGMEIGTGIGMGKEGTRPGVGRMKVEYQLGIRHAFAVKRNLVLLSASFAVSIMLFLGFSVMVDFMHHAIQPLQPWYPDVSIVSGDNSLSLGEEIGRRLENMAGVKRAYGRKFAYGLPVVGGKAVECVNLVSYEKYQFGWAEENIAEGNLDWARQEEPLAGLSAESSTESPAVKVMVARSDVYQWEIGDRVWIDVPEGVKEVEIAAIMVSSVFGREENFICTEDGFMELMGEGALGYTIYDIQLEDGRNEALVRAVKALADGSMVFSDRRQSNNEVRAVYYIFAFFVYGFLVVIALITVCGITNCMNMSINNRITRYGVMRAVGMGGGQLYRMVYAESLTYAFWGVAVGCFLGLFLHYGLYRMAVLIRWDGQWQFPAVQMCVIVVLSVLATVLSVVGPVKKIRRMDVAAAISML